MARIEQNAPVLVGQFMIALPHWMDQYLSQSDGRGDELKIAAINSFEKRTHQREKTRIFFDEIDERSCVQPNDCAA
jgi:hypothetical protein